MNMLITIPRDVPVKKIKAELEALCDELNCDVDVDPATV
jgi:glycine cleavage system regulatory protein